jgi:hypothetical protein
MSAFRVHCGTLLHVLLFGNRESIYFNDKQLDFRNYDHILQAYNILVECNTQSLIARYGKNHGFEDAENLTADDILQWSCQHHTEPVQVLKFINCINYQSCEYDEWYESDGRAILDCLQARAISKLDGYEDAEWESNDNDIPDTKVISLFAMSKAR